jgi:hypothetical protein
MSARADLCGGRSVMIVPTATSLISLECARWSVLRTSRAPLGHDVPRMETREKSPSQARFLLFRVGRFGQGYCSALPTVTHSFDTQYPQNPPQWGHFLGFDGYL